MLQNTERNDRSAKHRVHVERKYFSDAVRINDPIQRRYRFALAEWNVVDVETLSWNKRRIWAK